MDFEENLKRNGIKGTTATQLLDNFLSLLEKHNIKCAVAWYCGYGDSGTIERVEILNRPMPDEFLDDLEDMDSLYEKDADYEPFITKAKYVQDPLLEKVIEKPTDWNLPEHVFNFIANLPFTISQLIEDVAGCFTPTGYEISDGGEGFLIFDVVNRKLQLKAADVEIIRDRNWYLRSLEGSPRTTVRSKKTATNLRSTRKIRLNVEPEGT